MMDAQKDLSKNYQVITFEESLKYDVRQMTEYKYSDFNQSTSLFINDIKLIVFPNLNDGRCLIIAKQDYDEMFSKNSFPVLPENNTPYFIYRELLNKDNFRREKMVEILLSLGAKFDDRTYYDDLERFSNTLSNNDKKKLFIPMLYLLGEDLHKICPLAQWNFSPVYFFQPYNEPRLFYKDNSYSFYDLNVVLEEKLVNGRNITFKNIYKKVEGYYLKEKRIWDLR